MLSTTESEEGGGGGWRKPLSIYGGKRIQTFESEKSIPFPKNYKRPLKITCFLNIYTLFLYFCIFSVI